MLTVDNNQQRLWRNKSGCFVKITEFLFLFLFFFCNSDAQRIQKNILWASSKIYL